jgi:hypothetical protein
MDYSQFMGVLNSANNLLEHFASFFLVHAFLTNNIIEEFSPFHVLHDQKEVFGGFYDFV